MQKIKRVRLENNKDSKHKTIKRITLSKSTARDTNRITDELSQAVNRYFAGHNRIAAVPARHFKGMGDWIEIYDLGSTHFVGAIYPDGAAMIWPMIWHTSNKKELIKESTYKYEPTYSSIMIERRRVRSLPLSEQRAIRSGGKKRFRTKLKNIVRKRVRGSLSPKIKRRKLK